MRCTIEAYQGNSYGDNKNDGSHGNNGNQGSHSNIGGDISDHVNNNVPISISYDNSNNSSNSSNNVNNGDNNRYIGNSSYLFPVSPVLSSPPRTPTRSPSSSLSLTPDPSSSLSLTPNTSLNFYPSLTPNPSLSLSSSLPLPLPYLSTNRDNGFDLSQFIVTVSTITIAVIILSILGIYRTLLLNRFVYRRNEYVEIR